MSGPLKLGAEPKKMLALGGLLLVAAGIYFFGQSGSDSPSDSGKTAAPAPGRRVLQSAQQAPEVESVAPKAGPSSAGKAVSRDFKPSMKRRAGETADPEKADPTLRTDLLVKLASVRVDRVQRSLFDFSASAVAPTAKLPDPKIVVGKPPVQRMVGPEPPPAPPPPLVKPPPPPIPLKFYGRALPLGGGIRRVFCLLNDEIAIPAEGEVVQRRYKIHHITATTVVVEDLNFNNRQTLSIEEPITTGGG